MLLCVTQINQYILRRIFYLLVPASERLQSYFWKMWELVERYVSIEHEHSGQ